jgi:hypothetical protein
MIVASAIMPHISFQREIDDRLSHLARADRPDCDRGLGGMLMSSDIIQFIPHPRHASEQTDFSTIAFRSATRVFTTDRVDAASCEYAEPESRETNMPKMLTSIRSLARSHTRTALSVLVKVMRSEDATPAARVSAANAILDRGWGKATQPVGSSEDGAVQLIHRIERIIVHPAIVHSENSDRPDL